MAEGTLRTVSTARATTQPSARVTVPLLSVSVSLCPFLVPICFVNSSSFATSFLFFSPSSPVLPGPSCPTGPPRFPPSCFLCPLPVHGSLSCPLFASFLLPLPTAPCPLQFVVVMSIVNFKPLTYDDYVFPLWANWVGWGIALSSMVLVPAYSVYKFLSTRGSLREVRSGAPGEGGDGRAVPSHPCEMRGDTHRNMDPEPPQWPSHLPPPTLSFHIGTLGMTIRALRS